MPSGAAVKPTWANAGTCQYLPTNCWKSPRPAPARSRQPDGASTPCQRSARLASRLTTGKHSHTCRITASLEAKSSPRKSRSRRRVGEYVRLENHRRGRPCRVLLRPSLAVREHQTGPVGVVLVPQGVASRQTAPAPAPAGPMRPARARAHTSLPRSPHGWSSTQRAPSPSTNSHHRYSIRSRPAVPRTAPPSTGSTIHQIPRLLCGSLGMHHQHMRQLAKRDLPLQLPRSHRSGER